jgi:hypothetical protein
VTSIERDRGKPEICQRSKWRRSTHRRNRPDPGGFRVSSRKGGGMDPRRLLSPNPPSARRLRAARIDPRTLSKTRGGIPWPLSPVLVSCKTASSPSNMPSVRLRSKEGLRLTTATRGRLGRGSNPLPTGRHAAELLSRRTSDGPRRPVAPATSGSDLPLLASQTIG